jgi:hypothetical protein
MTRPRDAAQRAAAGPNEPAGRRAWIGVGLEWLASLLAAGIFLGWAGSVDVNPMVRVGQVAGLATLQLRFAIACVVVVVALLVAERFLSPARRDLAVRVACAIFAGLASGLVAAGVRVALRGTPWALYVGFGDGGWISQWVDMVRRGEPIPGHYPPLSIYMFAWYEQLTGKQFWLALRDFQLVGTALFGPAAYLSWRLLLRAPWALAIGVLPGIALINPLKPYPQLTLVVFLPLLVKFLQTVRRSAGLTIRQAATRGLIFGLAFALLFMLYSGWFAWVALGMVAAFVGLVPWRDAGRGRQAGVLAGVASVVFVLIGWIHLRGLFAPTGAVSDRFFYFDTDTEPTYFAMWRDDAPGNVGVWPPLGELAGLGLFTLVLAAGLGLALVLGWRRTIVIGTGACLVSAWLMRMWLASESYRTGTVRLYPRTTMLLFYGLVVLTGFAMYLVKNALVERAAVDPDRLRPVVAGGADDDGGADDGGAGVADGGAGVADGGAGVADAPAEPGPLRDRPERIAGRRTGPPLALLLCPLLLLLASAGSAMADRYMPRNDKGSTSYYAWVSHNTRLPNGRCPAFASHTTPSCQFTLTPAGIVESPTPAPATTPSTGSATPTPPAGQISPSPRR